MICPAPIRALRLRVSRGPMRDTVIALTAVLLGLAIAVSARSCQGPRQPHVSDIQGKFR